MAIRKVFRFPFELKYIEMKHFKAKMKKSRLLILASLGQIILSMLFLNATTSQSHKVIGWIDAVTASPDGVTTIYGWACDTGKSDSVIVHMYAGGRAGSGTLVQAFKADQSSEPAVGNICEDNTNSPHRFTYRLPSELTERFVGQPLFFYGISTSGNSNLMLNRSGEFSIPSMNKSQMVKGFIDGIILNSKKDGYLIRGWACQVGLEKSIPIHVYFGASSSEGIVFKTGNADLASNGAIGSQCSTNLGKHIFSIPLSIREYRRFGGQKLYIQGVSSISGVRSRELSRSGVHEPLGPTYEDVECENWDGVVDRNTRFSKSCTYRGQVFFKGKDHALDCNGGTIISTGKSASGSIGQGIGIKSAKTQCEEAALNPNGDFQYFHDSAVDGSLIKNCTISGFKFGVYLRRQVWIKSKVSGSCSALGEFNAKDPRKGTVADLDHHLGGRDKRYFFNPQSVTMRDVHIRNTSGDGIFVNEYAQDWLIERSSSMYGNVGIYLERESRGTRVYHSTIKDNRILGIAIDASSRNFIDKNTIENNGYAGISLYKNCGEANGVPRYVHADYNIIRRNIIRNHSRGFGLETLSTDYFANSMAGKNGVGIWIASRQGMSPEPIIKAYPHASRACVDEAVVTPRGFYYPDYAQKNTITMNQMSDNLLANVIVEDDENIIEKNVFTTKGGVPSLADIIIGSVFRAEVDTLGPVKGNKIGGNSSTSKTLKGSILLISGSDRENNELK